MYLGQNIQIFIIRVQNRVIEIILLIYYVLLINNNK